MPANLAVRRLVALPLIAVAALADAQVVQTVDPHLTVTAELNDTGYNQCAITAWFDIEDPRPGYPVAAAFTANLGRGGVLLYRLVLFDRFKPTPVTARPKSFSVARAQDATPFVLLVTPATVDTMNAMTAATTVDAPGAAGPMAVVSALLAGREEPMLVRIEDARGHRLAFAVTLKIPPESRDSYRNCVRALAPSLSPSD
jgi:hypothetical protein